MAHKSTAPEAVPGSIVVGIDGSPGSDQALDWAADQAAFEHRPVTVVHGVDPVAFAGSGDYLGAGVDYARLVEEIRSEDAGMMARASQRVQDRHSTVEVRSVLSDSDPRSILLQLGEQAAMLVVGSRGRGPVSSLLLGSVSVAVSKHATCPVVVRRPGATARPAEGVLVGVDGTAHSLPAVEFAYRMASLRSLPLTVMHCYHDARRGSSADLGEEEALVAESVAGMADKFPEVQVQVRLVLGHPAPELVAASGGFELLVVGHHRVTALRGLVHDSVAPTVLEHANGLVAVVPSV